MCEIDEILNRIRYNQDLLELIDHIEHAHEWDELLSLIVDLKNRIQKQLTWLEEERDRKATTSH